MSASNANRFRSEAEEALRPSGGFLGMFKNGPRYEDAFELFKKAANQFKLAQDMKSAADCYLRGAECASKCNYNAEEGHAYLDAANCLKKLSPEKAQKLWETAANKFAHDGRFQQASRALKQSAEAQEEQNDLKTAIKTYRKVIEMCELDDLSKVEASTCRRKLATLLVKQGQLIDAAKIFEKEAENALTDSLASYKARDFFMRATLIYCALGDTPSLRLLVDKFSAQDSKGMRSREGEFICGIADAFCTRDLDAFNKHVDDFTRISTLDDICENLLFKARGLLESGGAPVVSANGKSNDEHADFA